MYLDQARNNIMRAPPFQAIFRILLLSKVMAFCRRAISSARGSRQFPGDGVDTAA